MDKSHGYYPFLASFQIIFSLNILTMNVCLVEDNCILKNVEVSRDGFQDARLAPDVKLE